MSPKEKEKKYKYKYWLAILPSYDNWDKIHCCVNSCQGNSLALIFMLTWHDINKSYFTSYINNQGALDLIKSEQINNHIKHIDIKFRHICD